MNWDDLKYFLAVCREGTVRGAAEQLSVSHTTVSRRIRHLESMLGEQLFERDTAGYRRTITGEEIYADAIHLEERLNRTSRKLAGKNKHLQGDIRITLPDGLSHDLFMHDFADFSRKHPEIEFEISESSRPFSLSNREADIAFRICDAPPEHLVGRKLATLHRACYIAKSLNINFEAPDWHEQFNWIGWTNKLRKPGGKIAKDHPKFKSKHKILDLHLQKDACKKGMGVSALPCFIGDRDPDLTRIPPYISEPKFNLWMLYHPDLRSSTKIQTFTRFISQRIEQRLPLLEGREGGVNIE